MLKLVGWSIDGACAGCGGRGIPAAATAAAAAHELIAASVALAWANFTFSTSASCIRLDLARRFWKWRSVLASLFVD